MSHLRPFFGDPLKLKGWPGGWHDRQYTGEIWLVWTDFAIVKDYK